MANTQVVMTQFKIDSFQAWHNFGTSTSRTVTTADTFKSALYFSSATIDATITTYTPSNEVTGTGYTAGGVSVTNGTAPTSSGTTAFWTPSATITYASVTIASAFNCMLLYNSTRANKAVSSYTFGDQTVTAGNFTLTMPTNDAANALLRLA